MPYVGVLYSTYFAAPIFVRRNFFGSWYASPLIDEAAIDSALVVALAGWLALMAGYFAVLRAKATAALPAVSVLPDDQRLAKGVAVVVGVAALPFLYLDNAAVVAFYSGEPLLPSSLAFPVVLAGQFVVFAMLVLFYLHLRGQLGIAGRVFLIALAIYYSILGLSTGMVNHGIKAVFALFMAYAVVAPTPTWRGHRLRRRHRGRAALRLDSDPLRVPATDLDARRGRLQDMAADGASDRFAGGRRRPGLRNTDVSRLAPGPHRDLCAQ